MRLTVTTEWIGPTSEEAIRAALVPIIVEAVHHEDGMPVEARITEAVQAWAANCVKITVEPCPGCAARACPGDCGGRCGCPECAPCS